MTVSGLLVVDKPGGMTSHDVVARVRRALGTRKVGHAGTLDPMATGVLIIGVGSATRLLGHLALHDKSYDATIRLGSATVTDDREGDVIATCSPELLASITDEQLSQALASQVGTIQQRPSSVSAVKVDGRRAYDRVRSGEEVELAPRTVTIARIDKLAVRRTSDAIDIDVTVDCSTGTYIRALARDAGAELGVGGHLTALRRTRVGAFTLDEAVSIDDVMTKGVDVLVPLAQAVPRNFPVWRVDDERARSMRHGQPQVYAGPSVHGAVAVVDGAGAVLALITDEGGRVRYLVVFAQQPAAGEP